MISAGVYHENLNFRGKAIVVKGDDPTEEVIVDGSQPMFADSGSVVAFCSGEDTLSVIEGLTMTGGSGTMTANGKIGGGIFLLGGSPVIKNCIIHGNIAGLGGGIGQWGPPNGSPGIEYCTIFQNAATNGYGGGIWLHYSNADITNCTILNNSATDGANLTLTSFSASSPVSNSIIRNGSVYAFTFQGNFNYCDIQGGWPSGSGNIDADPLFCNSVGMDFHLAANSPCLGGGSNGSAMGAWGQGCDTILNNVSDGSQLPADSRLYQNFPNPFNPTTTIAFSIPRTNPVSIEIFNILGERIALLADRQFSPGRYSVRWDAAGFPSGIYFYQLKTGGSVLRKSMILIR